MGFGNVFILAIPAILYQVTDIGNGLRIAGDDPWYKQASYYWPFNSLRDPGIVDQRGTSSVPGHSKNGLKLDEFFGSWADLGNFSYHCISNPDSCDTGFTVTFWLRLDDVKKDQRVVLQIASALQAVGTTIQIRGHVLHFYVNSPAIRRHVAVNWPNLKWSFVALIWRKNKNKIEVLLNATTVSYESNSTSQDYELASVPPSHTLIIGAHNARLQSTRMIIDELALWNGDLQKDDINYLMESKAADGKYTNWSNFSSCTVSCGGGMKMRHRSCTSPSPKHGGKNCTGKSTQTESCFLGRCPINGNYSQWTGFTSCTLSCGSGKRYRNRTCTNPEPKYGGLNCSVLGPNQEFEDCNTKPCPINGGYSEWSNFSECSATCNSGRKIRTRICNNPPPQYGGRNCTIFGPNEETRDCFVKVCPVDGNYSNWSTFGMCSKTCGGGEKIRTRKCDNPAPVGEGRNCSGLGPPIDARPCNNETCPISGGYSIWSQFSPCTKSCGSGTQYRKRNCTNPPPGVGGQNCSRLGPPKETVYCNNEYCPIDGGYGEWSPYTICSRTCGVGQRARSRSCVNPSPQYGGKNCSQIGNAREIDVCNTKKCPDIKFVVAVTFTKEKFRKDMFDMNSATFKELAHKIKDNVYNISDKYSALESVDIKYCGNGDRGTLVHCVLQFAFNNDRYTGVIDLQDALNTGKILYSMPVKTHFINSNDVPSYAPENVTVFNTSSRSINVTWSKARPSGVRGGAILGYRMIYIDDRDNVRNKLIIGEETLNAELKELRIYTLYGVRIMSYNRRGDGVASDLECAYTDKDVPDSAPPNVTARNLSSTELLVEWDPLPEIYIHGVLLSYSINLTRDGFNFTKIDDIPPSATSHRVTGLEKYARYVISMAAINDVGEGVCSNHLAVWTDEDVPSRAPNISEIYYTSSTSIRVEWEPLHEEYIHGLLLGYRVVYRLVETGDTHTIVAGPDENGATMKGLKKYGEYYVQVGAFTRKGDGKLTKRCKLRTDEDVPSQPPQNLTVAKEKSTSTSLFIHWRPVNRNHQNGKILGYRILYKKSNSKDSLKTKNVSARAITTELVNLTKYTKYDIAILAYTSKGDGVRAKFIPVETAQDRPSKPPTLTKVYNTSSTTIQVNWKPIPSKFVHGVLLRFIVLYRALNESEDMNREVKVGNTYTGLELKGLWKYTKYRIRVLGTTKIGWGVVSPEVVVQTDEDAPGRPPENVSAANRTTPTMIPVSWQPISKEYYVHGILRGYIVTYRAVKNPNEELEEKAKHVRVGPSNRSVELQHLSSFTIYSIQVRAFTDKGNGTPSEVIYAETCKCFSKLYTNFWFNPPYLDKGGNGNVTGIFPPILQLVVRSCCGECRAHGHTDIDFRSAGDKQSAVKGTQNEVKQAIDDVTELSFPIYGRMDQTDYSNEYGFAPLVQSAGVAFIVAEDEPGAVAKMVVKAVFDLWPLIITVFISAFFAGIVMWLLDFIFNANEFPASPMRGPVEGMWWAFVTMTTVGYGDRVPHAIHSKLFGIVWITCGLVIIALVMSFITTSLTMDIIKSDIPVYGSKVAAINDSAEFRLGIRMNAKMDQERRYSTLMDLYQSLKDRHVDGALIDSYIVGSQISLFRDGTRASKMIDYSSAYGVVMAGYAVKLQKCFREFVKAEKATVFKIITDNVQGVSGLLKDNTAEKTQGLFDATSPVYVQTVTWCGISLAILTFLCLIYALMTRKKQNPNPKRYEYSDYLEDLSKEDECYEYINSKETMKKILTDFHKNCYLQVENLKAKHRRELRLLARLKQEAAEKKAEQTDQTKKNSAKKSFFGFKAQNSIVRYVNGVVP
ncbi:uncharacterized protein [Montipora capricornis]|uniref:uncharacterized protein n=1 Tax=Montipora capricornis TaxID=246305 RepID=UPI0035F17AB7